MRNAVFLLCLSVFLLVLGTGIVAPLIAPYAQELGASGFWVGLLYSSFYLVRLLLGTPIGYLADRKGPKTILVYSLLLYPLIALAYWLAPHIAGLLGARLLHGAASAMMIPMALAYMGEISPAGREGVYMGLCNTVIFLANGLGPLVGGLLVEQQGTRSAFLCLMGLALLALGIVWILPAMERPTADIVPAKKQTETALPSRKSVWNQPGIWGIAALQLVIAVLSIFMVSFFPLYAQSRALRPVAIGFLIALYNLLVGALQMPLGKLADRRRKALWIGAAGCATAVLLLLFPVARHLWMLALFIAALGLSSAVVLAASAALSAVLGRRFGMGRVMGLLGSANSLGMVVGPLVCGVLLDHVSIASTLLFSGTLWLIGTGAFLGCWSWQRRKERA